MLGLFEIAKDPITPGLVFDLLNTPDDFVLDYSVVNDLLTLV